MMDRFDRARVCLQHTIIYQNNAFDTLIYTAYSKLEQFARGGNQM